MKVTQIFFPSCPPRFEALMEEYLFRVDPARTACVENELFDEYEAFANALIDLLVENDGVLTLADWFTLAFEWFGRETPYPFMDENMFLVKVFFPTAVVHVDGCPL